MSPQLVPSIPVCVRFGALNACDGVNPFTFVRSFRRVGCRFLVRSTRRGLVGAISGEQWIQNSAQADSEGDHTEAKRLLHPAILHLNGRSPECVLSWAVSLALMVNFFPHCFLVFGFTKVHIHSLTCERRHTQYHESRHLSKLAARQQTLRRAERHDQQHSLFFRRLGCLGSTLFFCLAVRTALSSRFSCVRSWRARVGCPLLPRYHMRTGKTHYMSSRCSDGVSAQFVGVDSTGHTLGCNSLATKKKPEYQLGCEGLRPLVALSSTAD